MAFCAGLNPKVQELAQRLAPGRQVRRIVLDFPCDDVATAAVEVILDEGDMDLVREAVDDVQPEVVIEGWE